MEIRTSFETLKPLARQIRRILDFDMSEQRLIYSNLFVQKAITTVLSKSQCGKVGRTCFVGTPAGALPSLCSKLGSYICLRPWTICIPNASWYTQVS